MSSGTYFKFNYEGMGEYLHSSEVANACEEFATTVGEIVDVYSGQSRVNVSVKAGDSNDDRSNS